MKTSIDLKWKEKMSFTTEVDGHKITIDSKEEFGGENQGPTPKPLMLVSLAGCTAMDVISMLQKMRVEIKDFSVEVEADSTEEHPKHYYQMKIIYKFWGDDLPKDKIEKAVNLSNEKYCGVSAVYQKAMKLTHEIKINP